MRPGSFGRLRRDTAGLTSSTLKEPYRVEGKKNDGPGNRRNSSAGNCPDCNRLIRLGGGTGLIGMWKAFDELTQLGWAGRAAAEK